MGSPQAALEPFHELVFSERGERVGWRGIGALFTHLPCVLLPSLHWDLPPMAFVVLLCHAPRRARREQGMRHKSVLTLGETYL